MRRVITFPPKEGGALCAELFLLPKERRSTLRRRDQAGRDIALVHPWDHPATLTASLIRLFVGVPGRLPGTISLGLVMVWTLVAPLGCRNVRFEGGFKDGWEGLPGLIILTVLMLFDRFRCF